MKRLLLAVACLGAVLNASAFSTSSYVQDGLIACWDGIENAGAGVHNPTTTVWKDVIGGYEFTLNNVTVDADRMTFAGNEFSYGTLSATDTAATFGAAINGTMEVVYVSRNGASNQMLLQTPPAVGTAFGFFLNGDYCIYSRSDLSGPVFPFASGSATNSVSVRFTSGAPVSAMANGSNVPSNGKNGNWVTTGEVTTLGTRTSKANNHFPGSIYCIRLYSRKLTNSEIAANHAIDQLRFVSDLNSALMVSTKPDFMGSPDPSFGLVEGLSAGDAREVSCGAAVCTNAAGSAEFTCTGWKLYNTNDAVVSSGSGTSFTYTHPTPAEFRRLEWQWETTRRFTDFSNYVQDGLIACWDGIGNAGVGVHADNAAAWKDVIGGYEFVLTNVSVNADNMDFAGNEFSYGVLSAAGTAATFDAAKNGTLEIVFVSRSSAVPQVMLQTPADNGMTFGYSSGAASYVLYSGSVAKPLFLLSQKVSEMYSFSVRYTSGEPVTALANGEVVNSPSGGYWTPGEGDETFVGNRASKAHGFPGSIYCIRLYSRQLTDEEIVANCAVDTRRFPNGNVPESTLVVSGTPDGIGAPSPAYGYVTELSAGDTRAVSCGVIPWQDATGTNKYTCSGWKLYDRNGMLVGSGNGTSFTYTHPTPADYRRLEWQWKATASFGITIYVR